MPLVFQDRQFDARGMLVYDSFSHNGFVGDKFLVNGKIQPFFNVEPRKIASVPQRIERTTVRVRASRREPG